MLLDIGKFVAQLFLFGLAYGIVWYMIQFVDSFLPISGEFRIVILGLFSVIPIIYFVGRARDLFLQTGMAKE